MAIKTDAMIAHNGAEGYTLHIDYDQDTEEFNAKAIFNDGTEKSISGDMGSNEKLKQLLNGSITTLYSDVTTLRGYVLSYCNALVSIDLPECTSINTHAVYNCTSLKTVKIPKAQYIRVNGFERTTALESIELPSAVTLESASFRTCSMLKYIFLGSSVTSIHNTSFEGVDGATFDCGFSADSPAAANAPWGATNATVNYDVAEPNPPALSSLSITPDPGLIQNIDLEPLEEIQPVEPEPVVEVKKTKRSAK